MATRKAGGGKSQSLPTVKHEECAELAWRALCDGIYTYRGIARYVNDRTGHKHSHHWAQTVLRAQSRLVEELLDDGAISARAEYIQGLRQRMAQFAVIANTPGTKDSDKLTALKGMVDVQEKLAAARGVVTERKGVQHGEDPEHPFRWWERVSEVVSGDAEDTGAKS